MTFSCHRGPYVVLPCARIFPLGMAPRPVASDIPATVEAPVLRSSLTKAASSHQTVWYAYYKKGAYNRACDYCVGSWRRFLLWLTYACGSGLVLRLTWRVPSRSFCLDGMLDRGLGRPLHLIDLLAGDLVDRSASQTWSAGTWSSASPRRLACRGTWSSAPPHKLAW